jgi:Na+-transporting NADH:ubiquinone oxidoreductase subunit NqrF
MRNILALWLVLFLVSCGSKTTYEAFRKENKEEVAVCFGASSFLVRTLIGKEEFEDLTRQVSGIKKFHVLVSKPNPEFLKVNFDAFLRKNDFEEIFHVSDANEKIRFYSFAEGEQLKEVIVEIENESGIVLLKVQGDLKINDVENLTAYNDVK